MKGYKTSRDGMVCRWARIMIVFFGLLLILYKTLYPFNFYFRETYRDSPHYSLLLGWGESGILDVQENILLFLPLGFGLAGYLIQTIRLVRLTSLAVTVLVIFGLSYTIEVLQLFQPLRFTSIFDVISNCAGGLLGFLCFLLWKNRVKVIEYTSAFVGKRILLSYFGYAALVFLFSISLQWYTSLGNWDGTFSLLLGNERTGDRPWRGYISEVYIADRAISEIEVANVFSKKESITSIGDSLLASYLPERRTQTGQLAGLGGYHDKIGNLPDLVWRGESQDIRKGKGVFLGHNHWLETAGSAEYLTQRIIETSQFTLGATVATSETMQTGPARIISFSEDSGHRNFTLGQDGSDLLFRLRTPLTGENGVNPELIVPDVFSTTNRHNLIITYDGSVLLLYVDGVLNSHKLELAPGMSSFSYLFQPNAFNLVCYKILYYAIIFIPLAILLLFTFKTMRMRFIIKMLAMSGYILLPPIMLEGILVSLSGRDLKLENLLLGMIFIASSVSFFKYITPYILGKKQLTTERKA